ncbi:hypothetical protein [Sphingorhabdus sp.]|uniref:hypothetical protein n=1 Tax=Sphingorhabdus sp. TaxID=1902408 RepID=UPI003983C34B
MAMFALAACDNTPAASGTPPADSEAAPASQQELIAEKKLSIEQAAEEATKVIEADAKAEIDAIAPPSVEASQ